MRLYLAPYLGPVLLGELSAAHVQAMFTAIIRHHQALGTPVSAATLNRIRATLRAALNAAMRRGLVGENAASRAELPRGGRMVVTPPKTPYSARVIALDHTTVAALREHRRRQRAEATTTTHSEGAPPGRQASLRPRPDQA